MTISKNIGNMIGAFFALAIGTQVLSALSKSMNMQPPIERHRYIGCPVIIEKEKVEKEKGENYFVKSKFDQ